MIPNSISWPNDVQAWKSSQGQVTTPLAIPEILLLAQTIDSIARRHALGWCVIGGAAVSLHLASCNHPDANGRSSFDFDLAADTTVDDLQIRWIGRLNAGGYSGICLGRRVDWTIRSGPNDPLRVLYRRTISSAKPTNAKIPLAPASALVAMKICLPRSAMRPKDRWDCRLLLNSGLATTKEVEAWISQTVTNMSVLKEASLNLQNISLNPLMAA
jgi:hypothetical protein